MNANDLLRPGFQDQRTATADGFYAESGPGGRLRHFGFYRKGEPIGCILDEFADGWRATRTSIRISGTEDSEPQTWLKDMIDTIYREGEAEHYICAFCARSNAETATLISGPDRHVFICDQCVDTCAEIVKSHRAST